MARIRSFFAAALALALTMPAAWAQTTADTPDTATDFVSLEAILEAGGLPLKAIILLSIIGLFLAIFFLFTFRAGMLFPRPFISEAERIAEEGDLEALQAVCENDSSPASAVIYAATDQIAVTNQLDYMAVRDAVEDEGSRQASNLWQRLQYLMDVAVIAPMVGLLGTVLGMLQSFANLQTEIGGVRPDTLSQGVAKALITTAGGLIVGIAAMILYAVFRGRVNSLVTTMEDACSRVLRIFVSNYKPRS